MFRILILLLLAGCAATPRPSTPAARPSPQSKAQPSAPRWQAVPAHADGAHVPGGRRHIIKRGETGISIARAYGVNWSRIAAANNLGRESVLHVGQALFIPIPARTARGTTTRPAAPKVRPGATPEEYAAAFNIDIDDLITGSSEARTLVPRASVRRPGSGEQPASSRPTSPARPAGAPLRLAWPTDGRVILSSFGPKGGGRVNDGINIKAVAGQTVRAAAEGEVIYVGDAISGFGLLILIRHQGGYVTAYGHLADALVDRGQKVERGHPIARAGSSGGVREPQLLFQVRNGRSAVDPMQWLPRQG